MMQMKTIIIAVILTGGAVGAGGLVCGPALADFEGGQTAYAAGRHREAFLEWELDADRGNPVAQYFIGNMYASGEGVDQDLEIANSFYQKAAEQGHVESAVKLATNYRLGQGVEDVDLREASKWLYMAAEAGHPIARFDLGELFLYGDHQHGLEPAPYHASQWFRLASLDGIALARFKLAQLYFAGTGVDVDEVQGMVWLSLANKMASGVETENKWSKMAMPLDQMITDDDENRNLRQYISDTYKEKRLVLSDVSISKADDIVASGAPAKIR